MAIFCPITSQVKGYPFEVEIPIGFKATGAILSDQVKSLDWKTRKATLLCKLPESVIRKVLNKVGILLD